MRKEEVQKKTEKILERVNHYAREGHARHVSIHNRHGKHLFTFPLTLGIVVALVAPVLVAIILVAFLMNDHQLEIHKRD